MEHRYSFLNNGPSKDNAWWLVILEKAMAKLNVNYANLDAGYPAEAFRTLAGCPTEVHQSENVAVDELWEIIKNAEKNNYPMVGSSG